MAACGTLFQYTQPPKASLSGTPSTSTSDRLWAVPPMPRSATPCVVGFAVRDEVLRKSVKPGTIFNASSMVTGALVSSSEEEITVMVTVGSALGTSVRDDVTLTASKNGAGCSVISTLRSAADTVWAACAKPAAVTTMRRSPGTTAVTSKRPSLAVRVSTTVAPAASTRTIASGTGAPEGSRIVPASERVPWPDATRFRQSANRKVCTTYSD
jgi:hypothetical protein